MKNLTLSLPLFALIALLVSSCGKEEEAAPPATQYVYVASGNTYAGNAVTMSAASNTIVKFGLDGTLVQVLVDYTLNPGDTPVSIYSYDADNLMVAVENATNVGARRLELVRKDGSGSKVFLFNSTAFSAATSILQDVFPSPDGGFLISRGTAAANAAVEKFSSSKARIQIGANPYVTTPGGTCATATTRFPRVLSGPSGTIILGHAAASPNNKIILINGDGYTVAGDCLAAITTPTVNHYPTAMLMHAASGKLLVGYGNTTGPVHSIYSYDVTKNSISNAVEIYRNVSLVQGISALAEMPDGSVLIGSSATGFNTVEKIALDATTNAWTRVGTVPFIAPSVYTRSISGIAAPAN